VAWRTTLIIGLLQTSSEVLGIVNPKECLEELRVCSKHKNPACGERCRDIQGKLKKNNSVQKQINIERSVKHNKGYLLLKQKVIDCYNNATSFY
jgi:hypothetical protein